MGYTVNLINFIGPLDLLLQLIEKQDLDITDVSLSTITGDYLDYTSQLQVEAIDLDWFSQVASKLVLIKSRNLIGDTQSQDDEPAEDQLADLAGQLQRYRIYQQASRALADSLKDKQYSRPSLSERETAELNYKNITPSDIIQVFAQLQSTKSAEYRHEHYVAPKIPIAAKTRELKQLLLRPRRLDDILSSQTNQVELIGNLLALLELIKQRFVQIEQTESGLIISRYEA